MKKLLLLLLLPMAFNAQIVGTWKLAPQAGALGVGPALGDISWWSNSVGDLTTRACLFDDSVTFTANGNFLQYMDGQTWLEAWQGVNPDQCGTPVAPHNGANPSMTYSYDGTNNTLSVYGLGAHLGLAKVINGAEITSPANASDTITYMVGFSNGGNTMTLDINFGPGYWRFVYNRTQMVPVANYNVTFRVDMSQYTGAGNLANGVFVNGSFNGWCGSCNPMTNVSGSLWEVTLPLAPGAIEYKFTVDGWNDQENFTGTEPCIDPVNDGFNNRYHVVAGDITLPSVCFNSCGICTYDVTFQVNMNDYVAGGGSTTPGVFLNGTFNGWCGTCTPMTDANMDGIWDVTAAVPPGNIEYKFTVDGWNVSEQFAGGEPCTITTGGFTNRAGTVTVDATLPVVCWQSCTDCPAGINELNANGISIAPNPASAVLNVTAKSTIQAIAIYDVNGRLVQSVSVNGTNATMNVDGMNNGLYLVSITTEKGVYTTRVIVE
ncbi:MAG: T9SS C-terminal target domain-containing protein [Flavobacteriia bacterium]|nr:T9SS C-terminal target domain-containing protein [Flavobacteriia bacterium]